MDDFVSLMDISV